MQSGGGSAFFLFKWLLKANNRKKYAVFSPNLQFLG